MEEEEEEDESPERIIPGTSLSKELEDVFLGGFLERPFEAVEERNFFLNGEVGEVCSSSASSSSSESSSSAVEHG